MHTGQYFYPVLKPQRQRPWGTLACVTFRMGNWLCTPLYALWSHHKGFGWKAVYPIKYHYIDVIMSTMASQITSLMIVYSSIYWGTDQRKHQSSASLAFVWGIHWGPVNSPHKWPVTRKMFPLDDVIMYAWIFLLVCSGFVFSLFPDFYYLFNHILQGSIIGTGSSEVNMKDVVKIGLLQKTQKVQIMCVILGKWCNYPT